MEQRRLRLGDILDDYCPRERRVTNHAVVAMIEEDVRQTRCTTCEAEHAYKGGREPRRRKKTAPGALYREVLAGLPEGEYAVAGSGAGVPGVLTVPDDGGEAEFDTEPAISIEADGDGVMNEDDPVETMSDPEDNDTIAEQPAVEEGPVHRPLIRATLPRPEGQKDVRQATDFTVRHSNGPRGNGQFRTDRAPQRGPGVTAGVRQNGRRFAGGGSGMPSRGPSPARGGGAGFRGASGPPRPGGKKRSR